MDPNKIKPKILFITTGYPIDYRPHECVFIHRSIKLFADNIEPLVIHFRALKPGRPVIERRLWDGINVITISCPQLPLGSYSHINTKIMEFFGYPLVRRILKSTDIIHGAEAYPAGYVAGKWAVRESKPFTFNVIGSDLNLFLRHNHSKIGKQWLKNLKGVVCNSKAIQGSLENLMGELPDVITAYRGVDTEVYSPKGRKSGPQASLPSIRFLFLGGFHTWDPTRPEFNLKGGHTLLEAWKTIDRLNTSASLTIGGPGVYQEHIREWQKSLYNPHQVFCTNLINPSEIADYIRASDVVIIPSLNEGLPNIAKEAQACGRPVLGTNVGGIPEVIENGITGLLVAPNDPKSLAGGIRWFIDNQNQIAEMGNNGRIRMKEYFTWERYKAEMHIFFQSVYDHKSIGVLK